MKMIHRLPKLNCNNCIAGFYSFVEQKTHFVRKHKNYN